MFLSCETKSDDRFQFSSVIHTYNARYYHKGWLPVDRDATMKRFFDVSNVNGSDAPGLESARFCRFEIGFTNMKIQIKKKSHLAVDRFVCVSKHIQSLCQLLFVLNLLTVCLLVFDF